MLLKDKNKFSEFFRRLRFYIFGFLVGLILVSVLFKDRGGCKMPGTLKVEELTDQELIFDKRSFCQLDCYNIDTTAAIMCLKNGKVNYAKSKVHDEPYPGYVIEAYLNSGELASFYIRDRDTISSIVGVWLEESKNCSCSGRREEGWN